MLWRYRYLVFIMLLKNTVTVTSATKNVIWWKWIDNSCIVKVLLCRLCIIRSRTISQSWYLRTISLLSRSSDQNGAAILLGTVAATNGCMTWPSIYQKTNHGYRSTSILIIKTLLRHHIIPHTFTVYFSASVLHRWKKLEVCLHSSHDLRYLIFNV